MKIGNVETTQPIVDIWVELKAFFLFSAIVGNGG